MSVTVDAIYERGILKLSAPLDSPEQTHVTIRIETARQDQNNGERAAWLKVSEKGLQKVWENPDDDVFNALLDQ